MVNAKQPNEFRFKHVLLAVGLSLLLCIIEVAFLTKTRLIQSYWMIGVFLLNYCLPLLWLLKNKKIEIQAKLLLLLFISLCICVSLQFIIGFFTFCLQGMCV